jgi:hypothetical protein
MSLRNFAHQIGNPNMILGSAMGKIQANHIDASINHALQDGLRVGRWPQRGYNFGFA